MKRILLLVIVMAFAVSCNHPQALLDRMESLADDVVERAEDYTEEDWEWALEEFEDITSKYEKEMHSFTEEETLQFSKAMGRYSGVVAKYGLEAFKGQLDQLESIFEAFGDGFDDTFDDVEDALDEIF